MTRLRTTAITLGLIAGAFSTAQAQTASGRTSAEFTNMCVKQLQGQPVAEPRVACACGSGYVGAAMTQRQFEVLGLFIDKIDNSAALQSQMQTLVGNGVTTLEEIQQIAGRLQQVAPSIGRVCSVFETSSSGLQVSYSGGDYPTLSDPAVSARTEAALGELTHKMSTTLSENMKKAHRN